MIYYPLKRLKNCLSKPLTYGLNEPAVEDNPEWPRYIRITDFDDNDCLRDETFKSLPPEIAEAGLLKKGDILLARSGATVGKAFHFNENIKACYAGYLIRARFNEKTIIPKFFSYITKSVYYSDWKNRINIQATIQNISAEKYYQFEFPCPQLEIQQRIVDYLDDKTKAIDARISVLEKKSDAYTRLKASVINRAVTRGLNPNVTLKDSGIEWIGMIPEHWNRIRLKDVSYLYSGLTGKAGDDFRCDDESLTKPYVPFTNVLNNTKIDFNQFNRVVMGDNENQNRVNQNDLIFLMSSEDYESIAKSAVVEGDPGEVYLNSFCRGLHFTSQNVLASFVNYQLNSEKYRDALRFEARGFTRINIKIDKIACQFITLPPISEQQSIAIYLDTKCSEIDKAIDNIGKQIDALKRLKRSLINEVVTGKRKV